MTAAAGDPVSGIIVMGVSGSGKTTVAALLADRLGWTFEDADDLHPASNIEKMRAGTPLTDADRWPWLRAVAAWMADRRQKGESYVIACSALRRTYRDILRGGRPDIRLVYLRGDQTLISQRQAARHGHFMPPSLVASQFVALEEPTEDERAIAVSVAGRPREIVEVILRALGTQSSFAALWPDPTS